MAAITTRAAKGAPLTNTEVDANFTNLNNDKVETSAVGTIAAQDASSVAITGGSITGITDLTVADGGTGRSSLTAENVLLGDGTSPVKFVAPGASGNVLTSNGTTWASAAPTGGGSAWTLLVQATDQALTSTAVHTDITDLQFAMAANTDYLVRGSITVNHSSGGFVISFDGPASPVQLNATAYTTNLAAFTSFGGSYGSTIALVTLTAAQTWTVPFDIIVKNGANAGDFKMTFRQYVTSALPTTVRAGSHIEWSAI